MKKRKGSDYRKIISEEFEARCARNPRYSLRAFARFLEIDPPALSKILNGQRGLSPKSALAIADRLSLGGPRRQLFVDSAEALHGRSRASRDLARQRLRNFETPFTRLGEDTLEVLRDWHHFAILELVGMPSFRGGIPEIAEQLGLSPAEAAASVERLVRVKCLEMRDGTYVSREPFTWGPDGITSETLCDFHRGFLDRARHSLTAEDSERRDHSTLILAVDEARLPQMRAFIRKFHKEFLAEFGSPPEKSAVFGLSVQCFKLNK